MNSIILDAAITVHKELSPGLLESAYELALAKELKLRDIDIKSQVAVELKYKGESLGKGYVIDILVEDLIIIEVKAVEDIHPVLSGSIDHLFKTLKSKIGVPNQLQCATPKKRFQKNSL